MSEYLSMAPLATTNADEDIDYVSDVDDIDGIPANNRIAGRPPSGTRSRELSPLVNHKNGKNSQNAKNTEIVDIEIDTRGANDPAIHPGVDDGFFDNRSETGSKYPGAHLPANPFDAEHPMPDINMYQHKKTLAQGLMDLALVSANANQLRYVLESSKRHPYYYFSLSLIITSLVIQVVIGVGLILNSRYNIKSDEEMHHANRINNITMVLIFILTFVNVFITAFGVAEYQPSAIAVTTQT